MFTRLMYPLATTPTMSGANDSLHEFPYAPGYPYDAEVCNLAVNTLFPD